MSDFKQHKSREDSIRAMVLDLIQKNPLAKPKELLEMFRTSKVLPTLQNSTEFKSLTYQKVATIKKAFLALPAPETKPVLPLHQYHISNLAPPRNHAGGTMPAEPRTFKNKRTGQTLTQNPEDSPISFSLLGVEKLFLFADFVEMVQKYCSELVEIDPNNAITEIPMRNITAEDLVLGAKG